jgi:hypothetical protein
VHKVPTRNPTRLYSGLFIFSLEIRQSVSFLMGGLLARLLQLETEEKTDPEHAQKYVLRLLSLPGESG